MVPIDASLIPRMVQDFRVIDTEGTPLLREVAVYDSRGLLILEARVRDQDDSYFAADLVRPLPDLLRDLRSLLQGYRLVAHNAAHDRGVIEASFRALGLNPPHLDWLCTLEMAQKLHPGLDSYALAALCDQLDVSEEPFCRDQAHLAAYDARFTYLLYRHLQRDQHCRHLVDAQTRSTAPGLIPRSRCLRMTARSTRPRFSGSHRFCVRLQQTPTSNPRGQS